MTVRLGGAAAALTTTDESGAYRFDGLADGDYVVTAKLDGYAFSPPSLPVALGGADVTNHDFTATARSTGHTISGRVIGAAYSPVTVGIGAAGSWRSTSADAAGNYKFAGLADGDYVVSPSSYDTFSPPRRTVTVSGADVTGQDFVARYRISGTVMLGSTGTALSGVSLALAGAASASTDSDAEGHFYFQGLENGSYTVTASKSGYAFSPPSFSVTLDGAHAQKDFTATALLPVAISGKIGGVTAACVTVSLEGPTRMSTTTDEQGNYAFAGLGVGTYTLTPSQAEIAFSPPSVALTLSGADVAGQDFGSTALGERHYTLSGTISGAAAAGVGVFVGPGSTTTDASGRFCFSGLPSGSYQVRPQVTCGREYSPQERTVEIGETNVGGQDFVSATVAQTYSISGRVSGTSKAYVAVSLEGEATATTTTDESGYYRFAGLASCRYKVVPSGGNLFSPASRIVKVSGSDVVGQDFYTFSASTYPGVTTQPLQAVWGTGPDDVWAAGDLGTLIHWNGVVWTVVPSPTTNRLHNLWGAAADDVWAVGDGGTLLHWDGSTWASSPSGTTEGFWAVWGSSTDDVWAVGGAVRHWDGTAWSNVPTPEAALQYGVAAIWGSSSNDVWAVGSVGTRIRWDGCRWSCVYCGFVGNNTTFGLWGTSPNDLWLASYEFGLRAGSLGR
ncbi:MAG: carboxypeptidase regulatory-like domain-containing protein [Myxococcales bacterium]